MKGFFLQIVQFFKIIFVSLLIHLHCLHTQRISRDLFPCVSQFELLVFTYHLQCPPVQRVPGLSQRRGSVDWVTASEL
jgi:hypothetical protein